MVADDGSYTAAAGLVARTLSSQGAHIELSIAPPCAQTVAEMQGQDRSLLLLLTLLAVYMLAPTR